VTRQLRRPIVWLPISAVLLALVVWRTRPWEAAANLSALDGRPIVLAIGLNVVIALLWAARSSDLLAAAGHKVGIGSLVPMTVFANAINNLTPGSVGELVRLYLLRAHHGVDYPAGGAVILIERVVAIGYLAASALVLWLARAWALPGLLVVAVLGAIAVLPGLVYRAGLRPAALAGRLPLGARVGQDRWTRFGRALERMDATVASVVTHPARAALFAFLTAGVFATYTAQFVLVGAAIGQAIDPLTAWGILGLGITAGVLSLLPFGLGSTDLVLVALLGAVGVPAAEAAAMTFGYRLVATLPLGLAGVASYALLSASLPESGAAGAMDAASRGLADTDGEP
jgi:uncharacterized protein (TIRG00374 family)